MVVRDPKMNLGNIKHATFDRAALTPAVARVRPRFTPPAVKLVNTPYRISGGNFRMPAPKRPSLFQGGAVLLLALGDGDCARAPTHLNFCGCIGSGYDHRRHPTNQLV